MNMPLVYIALGFFLIGQHEGAIITLVLAWLKGPESTPEVTR